MIAPREILRRIVVVGAGQVGLLTAIALRRSLPGCEVILVGGQPNPASFADWSPGAFPFTNKLHDRLGIEESDIVLKAGGSHRLVSRFEGWGAPGHIGVVSYGETLDPALKTAFARAWGGGRSPTSSARPAGSLAEVLANAGRFAPPPQDTVTPISEVDYALRWNVPAYTRLLVEMAQTAGIKHVDGAVSRIEMGDGDTVAAIEMAQQGRIEADFFVDCSGPAAQLLASHPKFAMVDWSGALPTRRVFIGQPTEPRIALHDTIALSSTGWRTETFGLDGTHVLLGIGNEVSQEQALQSLGTRAQGAVALTQGRVAEPWLGNVVALGDAAARFEPLGPYHLDLAHRQLDLLLEMLPGQQIEPVERAEYNRRSILMMEGVREILALHFASSEAQKVFGTSALPQSLDTVVDQFRRRGRIPFREESPLLSQEQFALLTALGFSPGLPPAAMHADQDNEALARKAFEQKGEAALRFAPPYENWLASVLRPSPAPAATPPASW